MVMKRNMMRKNLYRSIWKSLGRYLAIVAIIALGSAMFVGLLTTKTDMVLTGKKYTEDQNMFDLRLLSTYGWEREHVEDVAGMEGVVDAEGLLYQDLIVNLGDNTDDVVYRFYAIPERLNRVALWGGRMPENLDECLIDGFHLDDSILGTTINLSLNNSKDALDTVKYKTFTVVGYVSSPLYMDMNRGTTSVGSGSLSSYVYIPEDAFDVDYYTEINITIPGDYPLYSDAYNDAMEAFAQKLEPQLGPLAKARQERVIEDAEKAYADGLAEYEDGLKEYQEGEAKAQQELEDAFQKLTDAEKEIAKNEELIKSGEQQLAAARGQLAAGAAELEAGRKELESAKETAYALLDPAQSVVDEAYQAANKEYQRASAALAKTDQELESLNSFIAEQEGKFSHISEEISQIDSQLTSVNANITSTQGALDIARLFPALSGDLIPQLELRLQDLNTQRNQLNARRAELESERAPYLQELEEPHNRRSELQTQRIAQDAEASALRLAFQTAQAAKQEVDNRRSQLDDQFADAEAELAAGEKELASGRAQIAQKERELADGKKQLEEGKLELEDGWKEYEQAKEDVAKELAEAEQALKDAEAELRDARETIDGMGDAAVFVLDRNSNVGYNSLSSSSDIVAGVSRVFPAFFLLVAALVCITTMTRMIDEERTQIGTLKALGYSNGAIIGKYLLYAGSGAVIGCGLGVVVGSIAFPKILWETYKIMLHVTPDVELTFNWWLCGAVVAAYTAVMLFVTWYCCRRALTEEPAELIRPKAPDSGKKILLEYLPFWNKISFLNKVTIRNIFRYRQRLAMMLVGIGGCTALLVSGFGLRDSIVNVVEYQFQEVTVYDMAVYFSEHQTEEARQSFLSKTGGSDNTVFVHQSSIELEYEGVTKEIYLIAGEDPIQNYIDFHSGEEKLNLPGENEVLLSVGVAEALGIQVGDPVTMRNSDLQVLNLTVSGIYDNHVHNYDVISPGTMEAQWGDAPEIQMALLRVQEDQDVHAVAARISGLDGVMNVAVNQDTAEMVGSMMEAMDLVIVIVVACSGLLAIIVVYNLTNININERIREIATIKVLGFNAKETAAYIFKENLSLSAVGALIGLPLGRLLLVFIMSQITIDMVWFKEIVMPMSYVWSLVVTMLSACIVDFLFYFKLDKINMAEALKSVE